ncbi:MAG: glycosyltransferase family 2 protein [Candidatus Omnitrophota bacterium]
MTCDIIMPVWNQLEVTQKCIESIYLNTHTDFRLIIIDNASDLPTRSYLDSLKNEKDNVFLIRNEQNLGFTRATNQGFKIAAADFICLLNNDTVVCHNWLQQMIKILSTADNIGIANPQSNDLGQKLGGLAIAEYVQRIKDNTDFIEVDYCKGFCMLMKKEVLDQVGLLDENFGIGGFEETDFCRRAWRLGYRRIRVNNAYVFHHSKTSFRKLDKKRQNELFIKNRNYYYEKWGRPKRIAYVVFDRFITETTYEKTLELARDWHLVYLFIAKGAHFYDSYFEQPSGKLQHNFSGRGISRVYPWNIHNNIKIFSYPDFLFFVLVLFKILHRKRKRFDTIIADNNIFLKIIKLFLRSKDNYFEVIVNA